MLLVGLAALGGCATRPASAPVTVALPLPEPPSVLDELLRYAGEIAKLPPAERLAQCRQLRDQARTDASPATRLRLLLASSITEACGKPADARGEIDQVLAGGQGDERLRAFLVYHKAMLDRIEREARRRKTLDRRVLQTLTQEKKAHERLQSQTGELKALQRKLDALKAIEQSLDEPNDDEP